MTSDKQIAANRTNAKKSTGPKSEVGKSLSRMNAVKHGGLAVTVVLPTTERQDAWEEHRDGTVASLAPVGHLETMLAERIAQLLWRLQRVARYESEMIALGQERVVDDVTQQRRQAISVDKVGPNHPDDLRVALREAQRSLRLIATAYRGDNDEHFSGDDAEFVLSAIAAETVSVDPETFSMPDVVPDDITWIEFTEWTVGGGASRRRGDGHGGGQRHDHP